MPRGDRQKRPSYPKHPTRKEDIIKFLDFHGPADRFGVNSGYGTCIRFAIVLGGGSGMYVHPMFDNNIKQLEPPKNDPLRGNGPVDPDLSLRWTVSASNGFAIIELNDRPRPLYAVIGAANRCLSHLSWTLPKEVREVPSENKEVYKKAALHLVKVLQYSGALEGELEPF